MINILLADDHIVVRQGLRILIEADPQLRVIGEASDGHQALELVERLQPDVLVLDLMMPGMNGLEVARQVQRSKELGRFPHTQVVILSMHANEAYVLEALRAGALAYVLKDSQAAELLRAIHEAHNGQHYLSAPLSERAIDAYVQRTKDIALDPYDRLTPREREVLQLSAEGHTSAEIGEKLCLSGRTIEMHRSNLMHKLSLSTQTDLIRYALKRGIIE
jgi:two-component system response regulator NreC